MKKQLGIAAVGLAGLAAGAGAGLVLTGATGAAGAAGAAGGPATSAPATTAAPSSGGGSTSKGTPAEKAADRTQRLKGILDPLVKAGTISQAQEDAVIAALEKAMPARGGHPGGPGDHGRFGGFGRFGGPDLEAAAKTIGVSADDLRRALHSGQSIAQVAKAHNVAVDKVVAAMVASVEARAKTAVTNGRLTQAQADAMVAAAKKEITAIVNATRPSPRRGDAPEAGGQTS